MGGGGVVACEAAHDLLDRRLIVCEIGLLPFEGCIAFLRRLVCWASLLPIFRLARRRHLIWLAHIILRVILLLLYKKATIEFFAMKLTVDASVVA